MDNAPIDYSKPKIDKCHICGSKPFDNYSGLCNECFIADMQFTPYRWDTFDAAEKRWYSQDGYVIDDLSGLNQRDRFVEISGIGRVRY